MNARTTTPNAGRCAPPDGHMVLRACCCALLVLATGAAPVRAAECPPYVQGAVGGDYNDAEDRKQLQVVESFHFTPAVENLQRGASGYLGGDIGYTLEHFPNHHRALSALAKLVLRDKKMQPHGMRFTADCYFQRALNFRPEDAKVHSILAGLLLAQNKLDEAREHLDTALRLEPDNAISQYNLGLLHFKKQDYAAARAAAKRAYELGFPLPGLRNKLAEAGQWEP